jgi:hypothetical protein
MSKDAAGSEIGMEDDCFNINWITVVNPAVLWTDRYLIRQPVTQHVLQEDTCPSAVPEYSSTEP